jgi:hypothetical protein
VAVARVLKRGGLRSLAEEGLSVLCVLKDYSWEGGRQGGRGRLLVLNWQS